MRVLSSSSACLLPIPTSAAPSSSSAQCSSSAWLPPRSQWHGRRLVTFGGSLRPVKRCPLFAVSPLCKISTIGQDDFAREVLEADFPVLVGFCADWCGPCKLIGPIMESVSKELNGSLKVLKIDTDSSPDLVKEYNVHGLPTLILFKDGKEVSGSRREGTVNVKKLKELLEKLLLSVSTM